MTYSRNVARDLLEIRLHLLEQRGGNASIIAKLRRRLRNLSA